jgi:rhodanese-related sulfurtransferase
MPQHPNVPTVKVAAVPPDATVLDVREPDEWQAGHIEGALHVPMGVVPNRLEELPDNARLVVVCRSGGRSARVTAFLRNQGLDAVNLDGGMSAWQASGRPMVSETGQPATVA